MPSNQIVEQKSIGLVLNDLTSPFFSMIIPSVEELASENGFNLLLSNTSQRLDKEESQIEHFRRMGVDGLIIASTSHQYHATPSIRKLHDDQFPYAMVSYVEDTDIYYVGTDHEEGAFLATEHLISCGYKTIGYISAEPGNLLGELRRKGYARALESHGICLRNELVFPLDWNDYESGFKFGNEFVQMTDRPEAMFVFSDLAALGFEQVVSDHGFRIPEDVAIVGFDDIKRDLYAPVPLTTVHQPTNVIGRFAMETVLKRIRNEPTEVRTILEPELVIRASCGANRTDVQNV